MNLKSDLVGNLNGDLKLTLTNIENELIRDGYVSFKVGEKSFKLSKVEFNLGDIGIIDSKINYNEEKGEIIFVSSNMLTILNNKKFAKKFQLNSKKVTNLNKIFFKIKKNINTGVITIFDINLHQSESADKNNQDLLHSIRNSQELKSLVKRIIND